MAYKTFTEGKYRGQRGHIEGIQEMCRGCVEGIGRVCKDDLGMSLRSLWDHVGICFK